MNERSNEFSASLGRAGMIGGNQYAAQASSPGAPIADAKARLGGGIGKLSACVDALEKRLCTVLRPVPPVNEAAAGAGVPRALCSPLAEELDSTLYTVEGITARVEAMLARLEL